MGFRNLSATGVGGFCNPPRNLENGDQHNDQDGHNEKRWVDGVLARKKGLRF